jgi:hypothetical protein
MLHNLPPYAELASTLLPRCFASTTSPFTCLNVIAILSLLLRCRTRHTFISFFFVNLANATLSDNLLFISCLYAYRPSRCMANNEPGSKYPAPHSNNESSVYLWAISGCSSKYTFFVSLKKFNDPPDINVTDTIPSV